MDNLRAATGAVKKTALDKAVPTAVAPKGVETTAEERKGLKKAEQRRKRAEKNEAV